MYIDIDILTAHNILLNGLGCELRIGKHVEVIGRGKVKLLQKRYIDGLRKSTDVAWSRLESWTS